MLNIHHSMFKIMLLDNIWEDCQVMGMDILSASRLAQDRVRWRGEVLRLVYACRHCRGIAVTISN